MRKGKAKNIDAGNFSVEEPVDKMLVCQVLKRELHHTLTLLFRHLTQEDQRYNTTTTQTGCTRCAN